MFKILYVEAFVYQCSALSPASAAYPPRMWNGNYKDYHKEGFEFE